MSLVPRDPARIQATLELLRIIWEKNPDMRLGQLVLNAMPNNCDLYNIEDHEVVLNLRKTYSRYFAGMPL